jgi:hypothetical protein
MHRLALEGRERGEGEGVSGEDEDEKFWLISSASPAAASDSRT